MAVVNLLWHNDKDDSEYRTVNRKDRHPNHDKSDNHYQREGDPDRLEHLLKLLHEPNQEACPCQRDQDTDRIEDHKDCHRARDEQDRSEQGNDEAAQHTGCKPDHPLLTRQFDTERFRKGVVLASELATKVFDLLSVHVDPSRAASACKGVAI